MKRFYKVMAESLLKNCCETMSYAVHWNKRMSGQKAHKNVIQQALRDTSIQMIYTTKYTQGAQKYHLVLSLTVW